jgi:arylsulfatase A-like enzyme
VKDGRSIFPETPFAEQHYGAQAMPHATYAAMVTRLDRDVGRVLDSLAALGLDRDTVVFFTSDNGPVRGGRQRSRLLPQQRRAARDQA